MKKQGPVYMIIALLGQVAATGHDQHVYYIAILSRAYAITEIETYLHIHIVQFRIMWR